MATIPRIKNENLRYEKAYAVTVQSWTPFGQLQQTRDGQRCKIRNPRKSHTCHRQTLHIHPTQAHHHLSLPPKAILDGLAKPRNRRIHILRAGRRKSGTEVQARQRSVLFGEEPRSAGNEHAALDTRVEDFLLNLFEAAGARAGMLGVVDGEPQLPRLTG